MFKAKNKVADLVAKNRAAMAESIGGPAAIGTPAFAPAIPAEPGLWDGLGRPSMRTLEIPIERIAPDPGQPRKSFDRAELESLGRRIRRNGQLQPAAVYADEPGKRFVLMWGERRYRAVQIAGLATLRCEVYPSRLPIGEIRRKQFGENDGRVDLTPIESAHLIRELMQDDKLTRTQVAEELGIDPPRVTKLLALLEMPEAIQDHVANEDLDGSSAYALSRIADPAAAIALADRAVAEKMTRDQVVEEARVAAEAVGAKPARGGRPPKPRPRAEEPRPDPPAPEPEPAPAAEPPAVPDRPPAGGSFKLPRSQALAGDGLIDWGGVDGRVVLCWEDDQAVTLKWGALDEAHRAHPFARAEALLVRALAAVRSAQAERSRAVREDLDLG